MGRDDCRCYRRYFSYCLFVDSAQIRRRDSDGRRYEHTYRVHAFPDYYSNIFAITHHRKGLFHIGSYRDLLSHIRGHLHA